MRLYEWLWLYGLPGIGRLQLMQAAYFKVTGHFVPGNMLRDARKMLFHNIMALDPRDFRKTRGSTPRDSGV